MVGGVGFTQNLNQHTLSHTESPHTAREQVILQQYLCTSACVARAWPRMWPSGVITATPVSSQLLSMPSTSPWGVVPVG